MRRLGVKWGFRSISIAAVTFAILSARGFVKDASATPSDTTALYKLVAQMEPGTWVELKTIDFTWDYITKSIKEFSGGENIFGWTDEAVWSPVTDQLFFIGKGSHEAAWKFVTYSASTNKWTHQPDPWYFPPPEERAGHAYNDLALDPGRGRLYHQLTNTLHLYEYDIGKHEWRQLPDLPASGEDRAKTGFGTSLTYFPEMDGLIRVRSPYIHHFDFKSNTWTKIIDGSRGDDFDLSYHLFSEYNPVHGVMLIVGGHNSKTKMYKLNANGELRQLKSAPVELEMGSAIVTLDPVTGKYLVVSSTGNFFTYDVITDTWENIGMVPWPEGQFTAIANRTVAAPLPDFGVTMFVRGWDFADGQVFLYKLAQANTTGIRTSQAHEEMLRIDVWPNPFNASTTISIGLPALMLAPPRLSIYNLQGQLIDSMDVPTRQPGTEFRVEWDASRFPSGIYFIRLQLGSVATVRKLTLLE